jgi:hypothetical protein
MHKNLFNKLVYSLLFLGYVLKDDIHHTTLSKNSIETLYQHGKLNIYYGPLNNISILPPNQFDKIFDGNYNTGIYYTDKYVGKDDILEHTLTENYQSMWQGLDLFDDVDVYIEASLESSINVDI